MTDLSKVRRQEGHPKDADRRAQAQHIHVSQVLSTSNTKERKKETKKKLSVY